jgi:glycerol-3-phosphate dehydrogenase
MYDVMATPSFRGRRAGRRAAENGEGDWSPARHRLLSGQEVVQRLPALEVRQPTGGYLFYDCQTDDARLVLTVLGEAERFGAICANRLEVTGLATDGIGVRVLDREGGAEFVLRADDVINATGVWADRIRPDRIRSDEPHSEAELPTIVPSRGTHVTVGRENLPLRAGAIVPAGNDRSIFALPWLGASLLGTTDSTYDGDIDHVRPAAGDIDYLLDATNEFFGTSLDPGDLTGAYAGVRPLISAGDARRSVDISRRAALYETSSGMITITGGKLTTWRRMAKLAVDRLVARNGREAPCRTHEIPLGEPVDPDSLPRVPGVPEGSYAAMAARYGYAAHDLLALAGTRGELAAPIVEGHCDLLAEAPFSASREQALGVADVLLRRTRLALVAAPAIRQSGGEVPLRVARAMSAELGWDEARVALEARRFDEQASAEYVPADE